MTANKNLFPNRALPLDGPAVMENFEELERNTILLERNGTTSEDEDVATAGGVSKLVYTAPDVTDPAVGPRYYPPGAITISNAYICLNTDPSGTLTFLVKVNGTTIITGTATTFLGSVATGTETTVNHSDYITVTISAAGGATGAGVVVIR